MLCGQGAVVVGQSIGAVCMLGLFLEESARLQAEVTRLDTPMCMERDEAGKLAKRKLSAHFRGARLGSFRGEMP